IWAACAASGRPWQPKSPLGFKLVQLYGALSGVDNTYGFFAPDVGSQVRAAFILTDAHGRSWNESLEHGPTRECNLRLSGIVDSMFALSIEDDDQIDCWAAAMFGRHPTAETCTIRLQAFNVPTMAEYRAGKRPEWITGSELVFTRTSRFDKQ